MRLDGAVNKCTAHVKKIARRLLYGTDFNVLAGFVLVPWAKNYWLIKMLNATKKDDFGRVHSVGCVSVGMICYVEHMVILLFPRFQ